jgi:hypothetical protein
MLRRCRRWSIPFRGVKGMGKRKVDAEEMVVEQKKEAC